jgi:uncharacterized protein
MEGVEVTEHQRAWFTRINIAVRDHMNGPKYDASHDYEPYVCVVRLANRLWLAEEHHRWARDINPKVIYTAALIHDVGNDKYHRSVRATKLDRLTPHEYGKDR